MDGIRVGPICYEIVECSVLRAEDGKELYGEIDYVECVIRLWTEMGKELRPVVCWHEALHAILMQNGLGKLAGREQLITILSHGIAQILRDNPMMRGDDAS